MREKPTQHSNQEIGRNDPCPCGSAKKYKQCCLLKQQQKKAALGGRKFTAKVISAGGMPKREEALSHQEGGEEKEKALLPHVDYSQLMGRSFGSAFQVYEEAPPKPSSLDQYLPDNQESNKENA